MGRFRTKSKKSPAIPTAALPDIIFILLFFFMVTTKMRDNNPKVNTKLADATQLKDIDEQKEKVNILIGTPKNTAQYGTEPIIQLDEKIVSLRQVPYELKQIMQNSGKSEDNLIIYMKVDSEIQLGIVNDVKHSLRDMNVRNIMYSALKANELSF